MELQTGFLLSYIKFGDHDAVLHAFTKEEGFKSFFVKGIYSSRNKKKSLLSPLNELCFSLKRAKKTGALQNVVSLEMINENHAELNAKSSAVIFFTADFLNQILRNEERQDQIYSEIGFFLHQLKNSSFSSHLVFLLRILKTQGLLPLSSSSGYLDPESGSFTEQQQHQLFNSEISELWKRLINSDQPYETSIPSPLRKDFLESLLLYYHYHFPDFRIPSSLEIVQQIFE